MELATLRLGVFGAFVALNAGQALHLLASCRRDPTSQQPIYDRTEWLGGTDEDKKAWLWLAHQLLAARSNVSHTPPAYTIDRLDEDKETARLSSVTQAPHLRYYAAVPIVTSLGIDIGYLAVVGQETFGGLDTAHIEYLVGLSRKYMVLLEATRGKHIRERWSNMNENLDRFLFNPNVHAEILEEPPSFLGKTEDRGRGIQDRPLRDKEQNGERGYLSLNLGAIEMEEQVKREEHMARGDEASSLNPSARFQMKIRRIEYSRERQRLTSSRSDAMFATS